jgi:hypothetical protein
MHNHRLKLLVFLAILFLTIFQNSHSQDGINPNPLDSYVSFINGIKQSPKDYILQLFDKTDIVIICERFHPEFTQYEMILDLIRDKRFIDKVGHIFTEKGSVTNNPALSRLMFALYSDEIEDELLKINRNLDYDYIWNKYPMYYFLKEVALLNNS